MCEASLKMGILLSRWRVSCQRCQSWSRGMEVLTSTYLQFSVQKVDGRGARIDRRRNRRDRRVLSRHSGVAQEAHRIPPRLLLRPLSLLGMRRVLPLPWPQRLSGMDSNAIRLPGCRCISPFLIQNCNRTSYKLLERG